MRSSLVSLEFRRRRESLFGNIKKLKDLCICAAREAGRGIAPPPPRTSCPTTISQPTPRYPSFHTRVHQHSLWPWQPCPAAHPLTPPHTHTHRTPVTHSHPDTGAPASSPICILPCSGFSFNMQVFPQGRGRAGYSGGDMMRGKQYGKNKYF